MAKGAQTRPQTATRRAEGKAHTGGVKRIVEGPIPLGQRRARASEPTGARPEARSGPARRSGALAADLGRARVGLAERTAGP